MKVTIEKQALKQVLFNVQGLAARKTTLGITSNVLIEAFSGDEKCVRVCATDLQTGYDARMPANVVEAGAIAVPARMLFEIVRDFPHSEIPLHEVNNRWIEIGRDSLEYHMVGMNPEDMPEVASLPDITFFTMSADALAVAIGRSIAIQPNGDWESSPPAHVDGVLLEDIPQQHMFRMVSTDGSRLSVADAEYDVGGAFSEAPRVLIPKKALAEVRKFLISGEKVRVGFAGSHFVVQQEDRSASMTVRLLEGDYPGYKDLLKKKEACIEVSLELSTTIAMIKRMRVFESPRNTAIILTLSHGRLRIETANPEIGESSEEMAIEFEGAEMTAALNGKFLSDAMVAVGRGNALRLDMTDGSSPVFVSGEDPGYVGIVMPMKA